VGVVLKLVIPVLVLLPLALPLAAVRPLAGAALVAAGAREVGARRRGPVTDAPLPFSNIQNTKDSNKQSSTTEEQREKGRGWEGNQR
jgi:hypothetical protein